MLPDLPALPEHSICLVLGAPKLHLLKVPGKLVDTEYVKWYLEEEPQMHEPAWDKSGSSDVSRVE